MFVTYNSHPVNLSLQKAQQKCCVQAFFQKTTPNFEIYNFYTLFYIKQMTILI